MSVLAIGDLLFSDLLSELNIKPWWEKFRGYCFAASVASALFMTYTIQLSPTTISCTPLIRGNVSSKIEFSATQASFIDNYCYNQIPSYVNNTGIIPLVSTILILAASTWWLHILEVISAFRTFAKFCEDIENLKLSPEQLSNYCSSYSEPGVSKALRNFSNTCHLLWKYESSFDVNRCYFIRNVILLCITIPSAVALIVLAVFLYPDDNNFECSLDINDECKIYGTTETMRLQFCSYITSKNLVPFMIFSSLSIFAQAIFIVIGMRKTYSYSLYSLSVKASKAYDYSVFMINFWENARPFGSKSLRNLIEWMFTGALDDIIDQMENLISNNDYEKINLYSSLKGMGGSYIIQVMKEIVKKKDLTTSMYVSTVNAIDHLDSIEWRYDIEQFIIFLYEKKYWRLFVRVLFVDVWSGLDWNDQENRKKAATCIENLYINTDEIGEFHLDSHRPSILYYVIEDKPQHIDTYIETLLSLTDVAYVHFDGESKSILDVFQNLKKSQSIQRTVGYLPFLAEVFFECIRSESGSLEAIISLFERHKIVTKRFENQPDQKEEYFKYQKEFAKKLSCFKFRYWNFYIEELTKFVQSKKQWVVLVELLNSIIVPPETNKPPISRAIAVDCFGDSFTLTDQDADGASILYYALDKPIHFRERVETLRNIKFPFTAIRYILKFTDGQEKIVVYPTINLQNKKKSAEKYVEDIQNIDNNTKTELQRILKESTGRYPTPTPIPANQSYEGDNIAGPSSDKNSFREVQPQTSRTTYAYQKEENDLQNSSNPESSHTKKDCPEDIVDDSLDSTSSESSLTTNAYQVEKEIDPLLRKNTSD